MEGTQRLLMARRKIKPLAMAEKPTMEDAGVTVA
jgi:hypothetical protein